MNSENLPQQDMAEILVPSRNLEESIGFFRDQLGFRLDMIFPADAPRVAVMSGQGLRVRLDTESSMLGPTLFVRTADTELLSRAQPMQGPGGVHVLARPPEAEILDVPLVPMRHVEPEPDDSAWGVGRAGMQYRDLLPGRLGGAWIASHIRIPVGGPVPDYVHHHHIRFQMIFCRRGWVRVVYEDQGQPFVMRPGDCVLQPPHIRHRVLECSDGFEVVEVGSPAEHRTLVDHDMTLPNSESAPSRSFSGQRFVRHIAADAVWEASNYRGLLRQRTGVDAASGGIADVSVLQPDGSSTRSEIGSDRAFVFRFLLEGSLTLNVADESESLKPGAAFVMPAGVPHSIHALSRDCRILEVAGH